MGSCQHINIGYFQQTTDYLKKNDTFSLNVKVYRIEILCTAVTILAVKSTRLIFYKAAALQMTYSLPEMGIFRQASCRQLHFPRFQNFFFLKRQHRFSFIQHRSVSTFSWHGGLRFSSDSIRELNPKCIKRVQSFFSSADGCRFCESQQRWYTRFNATALIFVKPSPVVSDMYSSCCNDFLFVFTEPLDHSMSKRLWLQIMTITPEEINEHVFNVELKANRLNTLLSQLCMKRPSSSLKRNWVSFISSCILHSIELK